MADSLRPLRIRLVDPQRVAELMEFLRKRSCVAEQVGSVIIDVWPPPLLHEHDPAVKDEPLALEDGQVACATCGDAVEEALSRLGSPRCHDCRDEANVRSLDALANGNGHHRAERARLELEAYIRAWRAESGAAATIY